MNKHTQATDRAAKGRRSRRAALLMTAAMAGSALAAGPATAAADTQRPSTPTGLRATGVGTNTVDLAWNPSTDDVGVTGYRIYDSDSLKVLTEASGRMNADGHVTLQVGGLAVGTHRLQVRAIDAAGNESWRSNIVTRTVTGSDTERPSVPGRPQVVRQNGGDVVLRWNPSTDNVQVTGYQVVDMHTGDIIFDTPLRIIGTPVTLEVGEYALYTFAFDAAGNRSYRSGITNVTVLSPDGDTERPSTPTDLRAAGTTLTWNISTDNVKVEGYTVYDADTGAVLGTGFNPGLNWERGVAQLHVLPPKTYRLYVKAYDAAGNESWRTNIVTMTVN